MKKNGFTMVELMITVGILAILVSFISGLMINADKARQKELLVQKMDNSLNRTLDIIKRVARATQNEGSYIMSSSGNGEFSTATNIIRGHGVTSSAILNLIVINDGNTGNSVQFVYDPVEHTICINGNSDDAIGSNIYEVEFTYAPAAVTGNLGILRIGLTMRVKSGYEKNGYMERKITDAVVTRVNLKQRRN